AFSERRRVEQGPRGDRTARRPAREERALDPRIVDAGEGGGRDARRGEPGAARELRRLLFVRRRRSRSERAQSRGVGEYHAARLDGGLLSARTRPEAVRYLLPRVRRGLLEARCPGTALLRARGSVLLVARRGGWGCVREFGDRRRGSGRRASLVRGRREQRRDQPSPGPRAAAASATGCERRDARRAAGRPRAETPLAAPRLVEGRRLHGRRVRRLDHLGLERDLRRSEAE